MSKIIIVPSAFDIAGGNITGTTGTANISQPQVSNNPYVIVNGTMHSVMDSTSQHQTPTHFRYDPLPEYVEWYTGNTWLGDSVYVSPQEIERKVWAQVELSDWLDENCTNKVLIQRCQSMWSLVFINSLDKEKFKSWWSSVVKKYLMVLVIPDQDLVPVYNELTTWCKQLTGPYCIGQAGRDTINVHIQNENDAIMFKLTWTERFPPNP